MENNTLKPDVIILAGGLGTRLKSVVPDLPKCMAPVAGKPFIDHVIGFFLKNGSNRFVFALGYMHEHILSHLNAQWPTLQFDYTVESSPLGTGGAVKKAAEKVTSSNFIVTNGDTFFNIDLAQLIHMHSSKNAFLTMALKTMINFDRYGTVEVSEDNIVLAFNEKKPCVKGLINGGLYLINRERFIRLNIPEKCSFEIDVLEKNIDKKQITGVVFESYFIDIGIPEDFKKAETDLKFIDRLKG